MGAKGAVEIIFRNHPDKEAMRKEYKDKFATPLFAAKKGYLDDIIAPRYIKLEACIGNTRNWHMLILEKQGQD